MFVKVDNVFVIKFSPPERERERERESEREREREREKEREDRERERERKREREREAGARGGMYIYALAMFRGRISQGRGILGFRVGRRITIRLKMTLIVRCRRKKIKWGGEEKKP
jgi:hypothetical protein